MTPPRLQPADSECASPPPVYTPNPTPTFQTPDDIEGSHIDPLQSPEPGKSQQPLYTSKALTPVNDGGFPEVVVEHEFDRSSTPKAAVPAASAGPIPVKDHVLHTRPSTVSLNYVSSIGNTNSVVSPGDSVSVVNETSRPNADDDNSVTPLHLLGDQPDWVDCPFCRRRVETKIKKEPSRHTHVAATTLFLTTIGGVVAPYKKNWRSHVTHICTNCDRKVAHQRWGEQMQALGTPDHLRQPSRFQKASTGSSTSLH